MLNSRNKHAIYLLVVHVLLYLNLVRVIQRLKVSSSNPVTCTILFLFAVYLFIVVFICFVFTSVKHLLLKEKVPFKEKVPYLLLVVKFC